MLAPIAGETHTVGSLFSGRFKFTIPYFQRGYGWQEEHAHRLVTNLSEHAAGERDLDWYPLGAIIVTRPDAGRDAEVADGHQRLITLSIVLAALRDLEVDPMRRRRLDAAILDDGGVPWLTTQAWAQAVLHGWVQRVGATLQPLPEETADLSPSEEAILANRELIRLMLADMEPERRRLLADFILDRTYIVMLAVAEEKAAQLLFSTINEAGLRADDVDLMKSNVLGQCPSDMRETARDIWEGLEVRIGRERFDGLLEHLSTLNLRGRGKRAHLARAYSGIDVEDAAGAVRFVLQELRPHGNSLITMLKAGTDPSAQPGPVKRRLQYLGWVTRHDTWRLPALHWLRQRRLDEPETLEFLKRLEALAWVQMISATEIPRRDRRYIAIVNEIDRGRALEAGGPLSIKPEERDGLRRVLAEANIFKRHYKLFLLLRLNAIYEGSDRVYVAPETTVEHILPQNPDKAGAWHTALGGSAASHKLIHALGNLTLLTEVEQNRAGNLDFAAKQAVYRQSPFILSRQIGGLAEWSAEAIEARTRRLIQHFIADLGIA